MSNLYNPVDMDGIPWTGELSNYIQTLSIVFSGEGEINDGSIAKGKTVITDLVITKQGDWSFSVKASHPLTGNVFTVDVSQGGRALRYPSEQFVYVYADINACSDIQLSEVSVLPTAVKFIPNNLDRRIEVPVKTVSPLMSGIFDKKMSIEIDTQLNKYVYKEVDTSGIALINGIRPTNGNININGVGQTVVSVGAEQHG